MQPPTVLNSSCEPCRQSKVKCSGELICQRCKSKGYNCTYNPRKKRGKARETASGFHVKGISADASDSDTAEAVALLDNEVSQFCAENAFPMKFISRLRKANIVNFTTAAQITEDELAQRFGELPFEQLLKWRCRTKQYQFSDIKPNFSPSLPSDLQTGASADTSPSTSTGLPLPLSVPLSLEHNKHVFDESQCAQVLSSLQANQGLCNITPLHLQNFNLSSQSCPTTFNSVNSLNNSFKLFGLNPASNFSPFGLTAFSPFFSNSNSNLNSISNSNAFSSSSASASSSSSPPPSNTQQHQQQQQQQQQFCKDEPNSYLNTYFQNLVNFCSNKAIAPKDFLNKVSELQHITEQEKSNKELCETEVAVLSRPKCLIQKFMNKMNHCKKRKCELLKLNSQSELTTEDVSSEDKKQEEEEPMEEDSLAQEGEEKASIAAAAVGVCEEVKSRIESMESLFCFLNKVMKLKNNKDMTLTNVKYEEREEKRNESLIELQNRLKSLEMSAEKLEMSKSGEESAKIECEEEKSWTCVKQEEEEEEEKEESCGGENIEILQIKAFELLTSHFEKLKLILDINHNR